MVTSHHRTSVLRRSFPAPPIISTTVALAQQDSAQGVTLILTGELFSGVRNSKSAETSTSTGQKPVVLWTPLTKPTELVRPPPPLHSLTLPRFRKSTHLDRSQEKPTPSKSPQGFQRACLATSERGRGSTLDDS